MNGINILVVGSGMYVCGKGTDGHGTILPALVQLSKQINLKQITVCATSSESISELKKKYQEIKEITGIEVAIRGYPESSNKNLSYKDIIQQEKFDCAIISTPDHTHFEIAKDLIEKEIHLLIVKPLAPTLAEAKILTKLIHEKSLIGIVEFHKRYDKSNLKLKEALVSGKLGDPLYFIVEYSQRKIIPTKIFKNWVDKTNIFQYLGVHYVDIIYFCTHAKPKRLMALGQKNYLESEGVSTWDSVQCLVEWEGQDGHIFTSTFHTNWIDPMNTSSMSDQRIKVIGTKGRYEADQKYRGIQMVTDDSPLEDINPDFCSLISDSSGFKQWRGYGIKSVQQFVKDVISFKKHEITIEEINKCRPSFESSLPSVAVVDAANKSLSQNGSWVEVEKV